jgi:hypothetical protein
MPPTTPPTRARPAAVINHDIRLLWLAAGGHPTPDQSHRYQQLVIEWATAVRAEQAAAEAA